MQQQQMEQQKLNDAMAMFANFTGAPANYLQMLTGALSGSPLANATNTTNTSSYNPGVMDFLSLFSGLKGL